MVGRLSPRASQPLKFSRGRGFTLADRGPRSDYRGNRRRSADSCRTDPRRSAASAPPAVVSEVPE